MDMRRRICIAVVGVALLGGGCDWLQFGGGPGHTGTSPETSISSANVSALVSSTVTQPTATGEVAVMGGLAFAQRDGTLTALDTQTYGVAWVGSLPPGSTTGSAPAVDTGSNTVFTVVAGASNPVLVGFDVNGVRNCNTLSYSCLPLFVAQLGTASAAATPPVVEGGKVFANGATAVYAFDASGQTNCVASQGGSACNPLWSATTGFAARGVGPTVAHGIVYDAMGAGPSSFLGAFDESTGGALWQGPLGAPVSATPSVSENGTVFVPAGGAIAAFAGNGCGGPTCTPQFALAVKTGDAPGNFLATPSADGSTIVGTNGNGAIYTWPEGGCGAPSCQPTSAAAVNQPAGASTDYAQAPTIANRVVLVVAQKVVSGTDHVFLDAIDEGNLAPLASWDFGAGGFGPGLASPSIANGVVYAPINGALVAVHPPPTQPLASLTVTPLTLQPAFSPSTFDYTLACAAGTNAVTIAMSAVSGGSVRLLQPTTTQASPSQTVDVDLAENQAAVVEATDAQGAAAQYWIRCLPHDFPGINVVRHPSAGSPTPGWYLTSNLDSGTINSYAMILNGNGTPVWYKRSGAGRALNVTPLGKDVVAFISSTGGGFGTDPNGAFDIYNLETGKTRPVSTVGTPTDFHEFFRLPNANRLLLSYPLKGGVDLTGLPGNPPPGPDSTIADCEIQEVDPQGQLVWKWDASDHIDPVAENTFPGPTTVNGQQVYDVYHCNSIDADRSGNLLVSARHLNAAFNIRRSDGKIVWKLGGKPTNKDGAEIITIQNYAQTTIVAQHDARYRPNGNVSLFDDQSFSSRPAQGVEFALDHTTHTAQPVFQFGSPVPQPSLATGGFRRYSDGESVICWGITANHDGSLLTEVDANANDVLDINFVAPSNAYRAVKAPTTRYDVNILRQTAGQ
jgi:hypothetical protein